MTDATVSAEDGVLQYFTESTPRLDREQERQLAIGCANGDVEAIRTMVRANLGLVGYVVNKYADRGVPMLDLFQEGSVALIQAAQKFDYTKNFKFSTYACTCIRHAIDKYVHERLELICLPFEISKQRNRVLEAQKKLEKENGEMPTYGEIAALCDLSEGEVYELLNLLPHTVFMQNQVGEDEKDDFLALLENRQAVRPQEEIVSRELRNILNLLLSKLTDRQQLVIKRHFGLDGYTPCSLQVIADDMGISKQRARQIEQDAMSKLKIMGADFGLEDFLDD